MQGKNKWGVLCLPFQQDYFDFPIIRYYSTFYPQLLPLSPNNFVKTDFYVTKLHYDWCTDKHPFLKTMLTKFLEYYGNNVIWSPLFFTELLSWSTKKLRQQQRRKVTQLAILEDTRSQHLQNLFKYLYPSSKKKMVSPSSLSQRG
jgi:hypothetical protein